MRTPRKLTALILMGALAVSSVAVVPAQAKTFNDVPSNHWAYKVVDEVSNKGIMIGTGTGVFSPNTQLTRAEYATVLANLATDKSNGRFEITYTDVPSNAWYASTVEWVVSRGLFTVKDGKFKPNKPISRELMADMTYKFIYYLYTDQIVPNTSSVGYADEAAFSSEYAGSINALTHNGLLSGRGDNKFEPQGTLTRAEAAAMASRVLAVIDKSNDSSNQPAEEPEVTPDTPSEEPEVTPDTPTDTPSNPPASDIPAEDPNDPANWDLDGAPEWFLVGRPDSFTESQWNELIDYWKDKGKPSDYPSKIPSSITTEERAKAYLEYYLNRLYSKMEDERLAKETNEALENGQIQLSSEEQKHVDLVNSEREKSGRSSLKVSPALCQAATIRAKEAAESFSHTRPDGSKCQTVLKDVGLGKYIGKTYGGTSEYQNLVMGENLTYKTSFLSAEEAFNNFLESPAHKENMLDKDYKFMGIACYSNGNKTVWCQIFCYSVLA